MPVRPDAETPPRTTARADDPTLAASWEAMPWSMRILRAFLGVTFVFAGMQKFLDPNFLHAGSATYIGTQLQGFAHGTPVAPLMNLLARVPGAHGRRRRALRDRRRGAGPARGRPDAGRDGRGLADEPRRCGSPPPGTCTRTSSARTPSTPSPGSRSWRASSRRNGRRCPRSLARRTRGRYRSTRGAPRRARRNRNPRARRCGEGVRGTAAAGRLRARAGLRPHAGGSRNLAASTGAASGAAREGPPSSPGASAPATDDSTRGKVLSSLDQLPVGQAVGFTAPGVGAAGTRAPRRRQVVAYSRTCTHAGCPVGYDPSTSFSSARADGAEFDPAHHAPVAAGPPRPRYRRSSRGRSDERRHRASK